MTTVLVIGSSGFVGTHLTSSLLKNSDINLRLIQRRPTTIVHPRVTVIQGSYSDPAVLDQALPGVDVVIHLAMTTSPRVSNLDPVADLNENLLPTVALLNAMVKHGVKKIIYPSSGCSVYGDVPGLATEMSPLEPTSSYGIVKLAVEKYLLLYQKLHQLEPLIIRVACLYGPGYGKVSIQGLITTVIAKITQHEPLSVFGDGSSTRDYLYIDDLLEFINQAIHRYRTGVYNLGSGVGYSVKEVIELAKNITDSELEVTYVPQVAGDLQHCVLDVSKIKTDFGWQAKTLLEQGMKVCCERQTG